MIRLLLLVLGFIAGLGLFAGWCAWLAAWKERK